MAAMSLVHSSSALGARLHCNERQQGMKVATLATARKRTTLIYRMVIWIQDYVNDGQEAYDEHHRKRTLRYVNGNAMEFGYLVLQKAATPESIPTPTSPG